MWRDAIRKWFGGNDSKVVVNFSKTLSDILCCNGLLHTQLMLVSLAFPVKYHKSWLCFTGELKSLQSYILFQSFLASPLKNSQVSRKIDFRTSFQENASGSLKQPQIRTYWLKYPNWRLLFLQWKIRGSVMTATNSLDHKGDKAFSNIFPVIFFPMFSPNRIKYAMETESFQNRKPETNSRACSHVLCHVYPWQWRHGCELRDTRLKVFHCSCERKDSWLL